MHNFLKQSFPSFNVLFDLIQFHFIPFNLQTHTAAHGQRRMISMKKDDAIEENDNYHLTFTNLSTERDRRRERENGQMRETEGQGGRGSVCAIFVINFFHRYIVLCCYIVMRCCGTIFLRYSVHRFNLGPHNELKCSLSHYFQYS